MPLEEAKRYTFEVEWLDTEASIIRKFYMFYFPPDNTLELFDVKNRKTFLKRTKCEGISLKDLFLGSNLTIFARQMTIVNFGDGYTRTQLSKLQQKTYAMLKPDVMQKSGEILKLIEKENFKIARLKMIKMTKEHALEFYKRHQGQTYLPFLVEYITSGPVLAMELVADNAVSKWRTFLGPTDPSVARLEAPETLRALYGKDKTANAAHGSDVLERVQLESDIIFPTSSKDVERAPQNTATFQNCTCCIIKPHVVQEGRLGEIISDIQENGFNVTAIQMFTMERANAEEFYEVYKGVVSEYSGMVSELGAGPSVALEIVSSKSDTPVAFRKLVGPSNPDTARAVRPNTLRAKYGKTIVQNAIHCTDLPEDGLLEVEYFFKILT